MRQTSLPTASEHLDALMRLYRQSPSLKDVPCLPVPSGYVKHEAIVAMLSTESVKPFVNRLTSEESIRLGPDPSADCWTSSCAEYALANNAPLIHITQGLAHAFADTDPSTEPSDYLMPFPSFILSLPTNLVEDSDGGHFSFVLVSSIAKVRAWWYSNALFDGRWGLSMGEGNDLYICGYSLATGCQYLPLKWQDIGRVCHGAFDNAKNRSWIPHDLSDQCDISALCRIVCNAILAINHSPELLYEETIEVRRNPGFGKDSTYKGPIRWLGKAYKHSRGATEAESTGRTHRPHWRRGHWHTVLHGAQRALRKLQWFQPTYVNSDRASPK